MGSPIDMARLLSGGAARSTKGKLTTAKTAYGGLACRVRITRVVGRGHKPRTDGRALRPERRIATPQTVTSVSQGDLVVNGLVIAQLVEKTCKL
jgi:hypothetical protein